VAAAILALLGAVLSAAAVTAPTVDDVVARYVAARGGVKKIKALQTLRQKGVATAGAGRKALVMREIARPGKSRFEFTVQGVTAVYMSDGVRGWQVSPFDGDLTPAPLSAEVLAEASEQADIEGPLVDWKAKGHTLELLGRETVGGAEAYKLKLTLKSGAVRYEYLDVRTLHHVRSDSTRQVRGRSVQIETTFADFKKTGGILFPRRVEVRAAGRPERLSVTVEKVEVNPPLDDARFELAPALRP